MKKLMTVYMLIYQLHEYCNNFKGKLLIKIFYSIECGVISENFLTDK